MEYQIIGHSMQVINIKLNEGEGIFSDAGKLVSKSKNIKMMPKLAGGSVGAIERKATGATGFLTEFKAEGGPGNVTIGGVLPGKAYEVQLAAGESFAAEHYAFIAATEQVKFTIETVGIGVAFFGGAGLILQKFVGPGSVFLHVVGDIVEYTLDGTEPLEIDPGHIAGFDNTLKYKITSVDNIRSMMFAGEGIFLAKFEGKGKVVAHSVSRFKLASELYAQGKADTKS